MIKDLAIKLKTLRIQKMLSQREVAKRIGISPSIISGYETGEKTPSVEVLLALSYLYGCSTDYLLGRGAQQSPVSISTKGLSEAQVSALVQLVEAIKKNN